MSGADPVGGVVPRRSFTFRTFCVGLLFMVFVVLITLAFLFGIRNLFTGMVNSQRASISTGIGWAQKYCEVFPGSAPESRFGQWGNWPSEWKKPKPEELLYIARNVVLKAEDEYLNIKYLRARKMPSMSSGEDTPTLISYIPPQKPRSERWEGKAMDDYEGGTLEMDAFVEKALKTIYPSIEASEARVINEAKDKLLHLSTTGNCQWTLSKTSSPGTLSLLRHLLVAATGFEKFSSWESPYSDWKWTTYQYFDSWHGNYVLSFINTAVERLDDPVVMSLFLPIDPDSGWNFIENSILVTLLGWTTFVLFLGMMVVWLTLKPLRDVRQASADASQIIQMDDGVPGKLENLVKELPSQTPVVQEYRNLLSKLAFLLDERERGLGALLHQLKNDLHAIILGLDKIQDIPGSRGPALGNINKATDRIRNTLNNVATYHWTLFGTPEPMRVMDLGSVLETIVNDIMDASGKAIYECDEQLYVAAQKAALQSALQNLLWNAHHHGGNIYVKAGTTDGRGKAEIVIDDDGPGIQEDMLEEVFKPYRQGNKRPDNTDKTFKGSGLGLTIARRVISNHGGEISIKNLKSADESIAGFRVRVVLPLHR